MAAAAMISGSPASSASMVRGVMFLSMYTLECHSKNPSSSRSWTHSRMSTRARSACSAPVRPLMVKVWSAQREPARYSRVRLMMMWFSDQNQRLSTRSAGSGSSQR